MNKPSSSICKLLALGAASHLLLGSAFAQSLWKEDSVSMVADKKAQTIGDIITIVVQESNTSTKDNSTKTSKNTGLDASISSFFFAPSASGMLTHKGSLPALKFNAKHDFDGGGKISNNEQVTTRIAVKVVDVLPNKSLVIEGTREISFAGEMQTAVLRGVVRPEDITSNNTVFSYNIADAVVKFTSKGTITNAQKKGWFTKLWEKLTPF